GWTAQEHDHRHDWPAGGRPLADLENQLRQKEWRDFRHGNKSFAFILLALTVVSRVTTFHSRGPGVFGSWAVFPGSDSLPTAFDNLTRDFVPNFGLAQPGGLQARIAGVNATGIKQTTRANPPAQSDEIILGFSEIARAIIFPAAQPADPCLRAQ